MPVNVSVIINTFGRPQKTLECVESILRSSYGDFEIIVVEQLGNDFLKKKLSSKKGKVKYFNLERKGASVAKNFGISKSRGQIVAFTDDDCLVDKHWLEGIYDNFRMHKESAVCFGSVLPYQPGSHKGQVCPCTFLHLKTKVIKKPTFHKNGIGFGNNVAFRKSVFSKIGQFKTWLGPGSIGSNAEDAEMALRTLIHGLTIRYDPKLKVWHDRWLTPEAMRRQMLSYNCGEMACYGYYSFSGLGFAQKVFSKSLSEHLKKIKKNFGKYLSLKIHRGLIFESLYLLEETLFRVRGILVALYFSKKDPLNFEQRT